MQKAAHDNFGCCDIPNAWTLCVFSFIWSSVSQTFMKRWLWAPFTSRCRNEPFWMEELIENKIKKKKKGEKKSCPQFTAEQSGYRKWLKQKITVSCVEVRFVLFFFLSSTCMLLVCLDKNTPSWMKSQMREPNRNSTCEHFVQPQVLKQGSADEKRQFHNVQCAHLYAVCLGPATWLLVFILRRLFFLLPPP